MLKQQYLSDPDVAGFLQYLTGLVAGTAALNHPYHVVWSKWKKWCDTYRSGNYGYNFPFLKDAFASYWWPDGRTGGANYDYASNQAVLASLQNSLRAAVTAASPGLLACCDNILQWGGVRRAYGWCQDQHKHSRLPYVMVEACKILDGGDDAPLGRFDGKDLRMNAGLTKIYSLNSQRSIIYDGRVGAALGLLVRMFLRSKHHPGPVPDLLAFRWGRSRGRHGNRNPGHGQYRFWQLSPTKPQDWALWNLRANWLLQAVTADQSVLKTLVDDWKISPTASPADRMRTIEAALFMVGYRV